MTRTGIVRTYLILEGVYTLAASLIWSVNTLFLLDAGLGIGEVFVANALFSVGMVVFEIPTGVVADTVGRRASYLLSVSVLAGTTVLYLVAARAGAGLIVFGSVSVLMGLGFTFYSGALEAWLVDALETASDRTGLDHVFARGHQVSGSAMFVGTIVGGLLGQIDLAVPFVVRSLLLAGLFVVATSLMYDIGFSPHRVRLGEIPAEMRREASAGVAHGWRQPGLRLLMISASIRGTFFGWAFYAAQPYFLELLERDAVWVMGFVTAGMSLAMIVGNQIVDVLSRQCRHRSTLPMWASAVSSLAAITIGLTSSFAVAVAGLMVVAGAMGVMSPVRQAYLHAVAPTEHRATVVSFDAMISSVGGVGGQVGLGALADSRSFGAGYVVGGGFTALAVPVLMLVRRLGGPADLTADGASVDGTCPAGLPRVTQIESVPVPTLLSQDQM
jgi:MFS family permease